MLHVSLAPVYDHNIGVVHKLINSAFPVGFSERSIARMVSQPASKVFSRLAYHKDVPVGVICAWPQCDGQPLTRKSGSKKKRLTASLYVGALAVLPRFQGMGVGFQLLQWLEDFSARVNAHDSAAPTKHDALGPRMDEANDTGLVIGALGAPLTLEYATLHCWTGGLAALAFYKRQGYVHTSTVEHFYERIDQPHAAVMTKPL